MTLEAFQSWVLQTGLVVSLLIIIVLVIRRPFARFFGANAAYALWSLPLIRLVMPGLSIPQSWLPKPLQPVSEPRPNLEVMSDIVIAPTDIPAIVVDSSEIAVEQTLQWATIAISIWLGVAALWLVFQLYQQYRFKVKLRSESTEPGDALRLEMIQASERVGLHNTPLVRVSEENTGPFVTGVFRPLVILPRNFEQTFDPQQRHFALVHEFAHIKRCDLWVALVTLIFRVINWPNPLVHYASHKLRSDQEAACDAFVVKMTGGDSTHSYAETLVKAVRQETKISKSHAQLALSLSEADQEISKGD
jgi:beta-lactamase regulating signal transducer with metallopeptidase domain